MSREVRLVSKNPARAVALAVVALALAPAGGVAGTVAPVIGAGQPDTIPDRYVVVMKSAASDASKERTKNKARARGGRVNREYGAALKGYAAMLPAAALADVRSDPDVAYVEADAVVSANTTQTAAPWGLDRIDQGNLPLSGTYSYTPSGAGVTAYVIDTGIRFSHQQFAGRATSGHDAVDGGPAEDCNGHGTHVAGTVGGATYGVAKQVGLVAVRVLDCAGNGTISGVIAGINWVTSDHAAGQPAVANLSLGAGASTALDQAVANSIADGVSYAVAAGNENANACNTSPARTASALTVGSTTSTDARSSFSNFGICVDLFAPGSNIISSWSSSDTATTTISGTSMSAPHVAGVAALYLQGDPAASPATVANAVNGTATTGKVTSAGTGSPTRLLYSLLGAPPPTVPPPPPLPPPPPPPPSPLPPPPPPPLATVCGLSQGFSGSLSATGASATQPNGSSYQSTTSGAHRGCVRGPATADYDLYLDKLSGSRWTQVARAERAGSTEDIAYNGTAGTYRWRVVSYRGSGAYSFGLTRPN